MVRPSAPSSAAQSTPDGFSVTLDCWNDSGDDEITECRAAAQQLLAVGIEVAVNFMATDDYDAKVRSGLRN